MVEFFKRSMFLAVARKELMLLVRDRRALLLLLVLLFYFHIEELIHVIHHICLMD